MKRIKIKEYDQYEKIEKGQCISLKQSVLNKNIEALT